MKTLQTLKLRLFVVGTLALTSTVMQAQTVAPGPYYATPSWDQKFPASTRFIVLSNWDSAAVLDRETGLVWERSPRTSTLHEWNDARSQCTGRMTGGRIGWRLPSVHELASLIDPPVSSFAEPGLSLPVGHPFTNVESFFYWSASTVSDDPVRAWSVGFNGGLVIRSGNLDGVVILAAKSGRLFVWCVRGGMNADTY